MTYEEAMKRVYDEAGAHDEHCNWIMAKHWDAVHDAMERKNEECAVLEDWQDFDKQVVNELASELAYYAYKVTGKTKSVDEWIKEFHSKVAEQRKEV